MPTYGYMSQPSTGLHQIPMPLKGPSSYEHERHKLSSERSNNNRISEEEDKQARIMSTLSRETYSNDGFNSIGTAAYADPYSNNATTISSIVHSPAISVHDLPTTLPPLNPAMMSTKPEGSRSDPRAGLPYDVREQTPSLREPQPPQPDLAVGELSPYGCDVPGCYASFPASSGLFYHMKTTHPNLEGVDKPYRCAMPNCTKRYKNINGLQYHLREAKGTSGHPALTAAATAAAASANGGEEEKIQKSFKCQAAGCKKAYRTQNGLRYHQSHVHSIPSSCDMRSANPRATWQ
ncbi:hypothetical protein BJV82DRAFT_597957 [Fennellomyces sp. T-0311]|nr:hypothetical protein BJV82DRAFT_597957 [Fennellomyces sp. T-0311]